MEKRGPGQGFLKPALQRMRRRVRAKGFFSFLLEARVRHGSAGSAASPTGTGIAVSLRLGELPFPRTPARGLVPGTGREKAVPRARAMPIPSGDVETLPLVDEAGNLPRRERPEG